MKYDNFIESDNLIEPDAEDFYDPFLDEENVEIDYDYINSFMDEAGNIIKKYDEIGYC